MGNFWIVPVLHSAIDTYLQTLPNFNASFAQVQILTTSHQSDTTSKLDFVTVFWNSAPWLNPNIYCRFHISTHWHLSWSSNAQSTLLQATAL